MWSCWRRERERERGKKEKKNTLKEQNAPGGLQGDLLSQLPDLSLFLSPYCVYLCKDTCDEWTLCLSFRSAQGRDQHKRSEQKNPTTGSVSCQKRNFRLHCIEHCIWKCRVSAYCIYYQPLGALKKRKKKNVIQTTTWTIRGIDKTFFCFCNWG